jgi:hypothetical protein
MGAVLYTNRFARKADVHERIVSGCPNPETDDIVALALDEQRDEIRKGEKRIARIEDRLLELQAELDEERKRDLARRAAYTDMQAQAETWKQTGGPLPDALLPACEKAIRKKAALEAANDRDNVEIDAPDGWERHGVRSDDEFVYVTFRRSRTTMTTDEVKQEMAATIKRVANDYAQAAHQWSELPWPSNRLRRYLHPIAAQAP